jgi:hypothetical protein
MFTALDELAALVVRELQSPFSQLRVSWLISCSQTYADIVQMQNKPVI